jgi:signal peptidase I
MDDSPQSAEPVESAGPIAPAEQKPAGGVAISWLRDLFLSVMIAVVVILFLYQPVKVEGTSMEPSLENDERVFINKFVYRFGISDIHRGDTVVFLYPKDATKSYIKRVIGLPGDTVEVRFGTVIVNGQELTEPYVAEVNRDHSLMDPKTLGPDEYFVLGDHRSSSNDSRLGWTVSKRDIYGKAVFAYWPLDRLGTLR